MTPARTRRHRVQLGDTITFVILRERHQRQYVMIRRNMQPTRIGALTMSGVAFTKGWIRTYPDRVDNATSRQVLKITTMLACQAWAPQRVNMALDFDSSCERKGIGVVSCSYGGMRSSAAICACAERERRKGARAQTPRARPCESRT